MKHRLIAGMRVTKVGERWDGRRWVNYSIHAPPPPPNSKFPNLAPNGPGTPKNRIPRVRFMKIRPGGRSGDLNRTDFEP